MKAYAIDQHGGPELITPRQLPDPTPGDHDLLVEVHASALNPVDTKVRAGGLGDREFPLVLGYDVSGVVKARGKSVQDFREGDAVYASPALVRPGANAELVCVDWRTAAHKPASLSHVEAAALPLVTLTAWEAMYEKCQLGKGETILIHGGAGGVGHVAIQLAKARGARVITTASTPESQQLCESLGTDVVIDYKSEDVVERVKAETQDHGCAVVFDTQSGECFKQSIECVAVEGRIATILPNEEPAVVQQLFMKSVSLHMEFMGARTMFGVNVARQGAILREAATLVEEGRLKPVVAKQLPIDKVQQAHKLQEEGHVHGKLVLTVKD